MRSLTAAHQGYEYQDLLVACRFVDMLLGTILHVDVDTKLVPDDRFDDLTTIDLGGNRERVQFKHTENDDRPLSLRTFTFDERGLRLDRLIATMIADRTGPGSDANALSFRIVLRDQAPSDPNLTAVLTPVGNDPGPFLPIMQTHRLGFDAIALWQQRVPVPESEAKHPFGFLFSAEAHLTFDDLQWACQHLIVEVGAPPASGDLTAPKIAEHMLLTRIRSEVGAELFPNTGRSAIDVSAAMISAARAAREGRLNVTAKELLRRSQLRSDFGAVSRAYPVDPTLEVLRSPAVQQLMEVTNELARGGGQLIVIGPPGHGKSWICYQLLKSLANEGWVTAEHYCYLGDADGERIERVLEERVFGSLVGRLAEADPRLVTDNRPRFAADEETLVGCLRKSLELEPNRKIALVIDGIDHITRVRAVRGGGLDPSRSLAEALSLLNLPPNTILIVLSQPGSHLKPLEEAGAKAVTIPGLNEHELKLLATRFNIVPTDDHQFSPDITPLIEDTDSTVKFLAALGERSGGNALYATYLCRETLRLGGTQIDPAMTIKSLPPFDGTLKNYYDHLYRSLGSEAGWVADVIALVDFGIMRAEFREIRPDAAHRVFDALDLLGSVLIERATQGGVRVYHESFARYLREKFQNDEIAHKALLKLITDWLYNKGLFVDPRAFRSLLRLLSEAGCDAQVVDLVNQTFVTQAVAAGFPSSAIIANLATAIGSAAQIGNWPAIVRYVELARAAESLQSERFDSTMVAFADVPASLLGAQILAARLTDDDRLVMPARAGLQMCAAVDALGAIPPWRAYMAAYHRELKTNNTIYGASSDRAVALAWFRGHLRLATNPDIASEEDSISSETAGGQENSDVDWAGLAKWIEDIELPTQEVIGAVEDTHGLNGVIRFIHCLTKPGEFFLAFAERLARVPVSDTKIGSSLSWATTAAATGTPAGSVHRLLNLGIKPGDLSRDTINEARDHLLDLTRQVQQPSIDLEPGAVGPWLDACALAAHRDPLAINTAEALIAGDGWYRCWLRFALRLSVAEAADPGVRGSLAFDALHLLTDDLNPFSGDPRACDLFRLHDVIQDTISRAMCLLDDNQWKFGLELLKKISSSVTTTLSGEVGGPVPPEFLLRIAVDGANPNRQSITETLIQDEIMKGSARRFYTDLAEYRLYAARLALAAENRERAQSLWKEACTFLTAYGWHKDITIYELLDPLPVLIETNPSRGRACVASVQGLCERVPMHTDQKETRHTWSRWWELLAKADPVAAVRLAVPQLLTECNNPNWLLNGALEDVWHEWFDRADPILSGALRLTLDISLHVDDIKHFERFAEYSNHDNPNVRRLMTWLITRADERPVSYEYSNSDELVIEDNEIVAKINSITESMNLPSIATIGDKSSVSESSRSIMSPSRSKSSIVDEEIRVFPAFPPGLPGLISAIRLWCSRPYGAQSPEWAVERFANVIGYRLIELAEAGRYNELEAALTSLASGLRLEDQLKIVHLIAEGLERQGQVRAAVAAYTLTWTYARGHGGWLTFGGETEIGALQHATALDPKIPLAIVAMEVQRAVATSHYGTYGISQALIYAFSVGALKCAGQSSIEIAFAEWEEAFAVINARSPQVSPSEEPDHPYIPPNPDNGEAAPGNIDSALALATLAGLAHPSREKKRRAFLAAGLLIEERAAIAASAFEIALGTISDPATLTWLLRLIESCDERCVPIIKSCQHIFHDLASRNLVTVRALARRLITGEQLPLAPPAPADYALLNESGNLLWTPENNNDLHLAGPAGLDGLLESVAGRRLQRGEQLLPRLRRAVRARLEMSLNEEAFKKRLKSQLDSLAGVRRERWPDAFLAPEQVIEETLQSVATGGRTARLIAGNPVSNPIRWEDELASTLLDDPIIPLTIEACRQPRPSLHPPPSKGHALWDQIRERAAGGSAAYIEEATEENGIFFATITMKPSSFLPAVEHENFRGWYWIATMEQRSLKLSGQHNKPSLVSKRFCVLEVRDVNDRQALLLPPITTGDLRMWRTEVNTDFGSPKFDSSQPIIGMDNELSMIGDGRQGLGAPDSLLVPTASIIAVLNLHPGVTCNYEDKDGIGLALAIWRAEYDTSEYHLAWPRICGSGIMIRPDLLERLIAVVGKPRLILRDFVIGNGELLSSPPPISNPIE